MTFSHTTKPVSANGNTRKKTEGAMKGGKLVKSVETRKKRKRERPEGAKLPFLHFKDE